MTIKEIKPNERQDAVDLVLSVFMECEAPEYSKEGIDSFHEFISSHEEISHLFMYGAYEKTELVGVIATRKNGSHISLFFVKKPYHNRGIGRALFRNVVKAKQTGTITVNSSPYAVPIYRHLGFVCTDSEQVTDGIRYTPMIYQVEELPGC